MCILFYLSFCLENVASACTRSGTHWQTPNEHHWSIYRISDHSIGHKWTYEHTVVVCIQNWFTFRNFWLFSFSSLLLLLPIALTVNTYCVGSCWLVAFRYLLQNKIVQMVGVQCTVQRTISNWIRFTSQWMAKMNQPAGKYTNRDGRGDGGRMREYCSFNRDIVPSKKNFDSTMTATIFVLVFALWLLSFSIFFHSFPVPLSLWLDMNLCERIVVKVANASIPFKSIFDSIHSWLAGWLFVGMP